MYTPVMMTKLYLFCPWAAKGVISVLSNIAPQQTHDICAKFFEGKAAESAQMQMDAIELINSLFCEVNPIPVKTGTESDGHERQVF